MILNFRNKLIERLYGRYIMYGTDTLTRVILFVLLFLTFCNLFVMQLFWPAGIAIYIINAFLFGWSVFRLLSKNIVKRQAENRPFARIESKIKSKIALKKKMHREKETHVYKKCPRCSVILRLPRKPGKHSVNCPRCKYDFSVKVK